MKIIIILLTFCTVVFANIGKVSTVIGDAHIQRNKQIIIIKTGLIIEEKDIIKTAKNSKVQLVFNDNTIITVGKNSALNINEYIYDRKNPKNSKTDFNFFKGAFKTITGKIGKINKKRFKLRTKTASIGIRGTIIVGNQSMIACTQGGITVIGAGISVDVETNELTIIQDDNAPSEAKTISSEDLQSLEQSIEPAGESTTEETTSDDSEESKEDTTQGEEEQENNLVSQDETPEEESIVENQIEQEKVIEETPVTEEVVQQTNAQVNNVVDDTQAQIQAQLAKAQAQEAQNALVRQSQEAALQAQLEQVKANTAKIVTITILSTLPTSQDITNLQNQVTSAGSETQTSLNSAVSSLSNATNSATVNSTAKTDVGTAATNATTLTTQALTDANTFQTNTAGSYTSILNTAQAKAAEAQTAYNTAITQAGLAQNALSQAQESGAPASVIASIQSDVQKANTAVSATQTIANDTANAVISLRTTITNTATQVVIDAQTAVNNATILSQLSSLLNSLEDTKQASLDATVASASAQTAKMATQTASTIVSSASTALLSAKQSISTAKSDVITASNDTMSAANTATNGATSNVQVAYSAKIAEDKANLAKTTADQAVVNAVISASKLAEAQTTVTEMNNQLTATQSALTLAQQKLTAAQTALSAAQTTESGISSSNTSVKTAAQNAVTKAQALYNSALSSKIAAQTAVNDAQSIVTALDSTTLLATLTAANTQAQSDAISATTTANTALTTAITATTAAITASTNVKTVMIEKTKVSLDEDGNTVDNITDTFVLSSEKTDEKLTGQNFGGYIGSTQLGVFKTNSGDINPSYLVQSDNLQEFFVSYSSSTNITNSLTIYGNDFTGNYDNNKIYIYKSFKVLDTSGGSGTFSTDTVISFYNPATNSFTSLSKDFYKEGATTFVAGSSSEVKTTKNVFNLGSNSFLNSIDSKASTSGTNAIKGSQAQGNVQTSTFDDSSKQSIAYFLNNKKDQDSSSITKILTGSTFLMDHDGSSTTGYRIDKNLSITITDNGSNGIGISATPKYDNNNNINTYSGTTKADTLTAYYINSDIWGAKESGGNGFIMAVPDGGYDSNGKFTIYDENDNPLTSDDDSSWGYWTGTTESYNKSINPKSAWVAGIETSTAIIQGLIDGNSQTLTFNGKAIGIVDSVHSVIVDDTNKVVLNFNVGGGNANLTGSMQFVSTNNQSFNLGIDTANTTVNNVGFTGNFTGSGVDSDYNYLNGNYYGDGEVKSVGGTFQANQNNHKVNGVFKATKE